MKLRYCVGLCILSLIFVFRADTVSAQGASSPTDGWQGPRPTPQAPTPKSVPQPPPETPFPQPLGPPSGKQTLEIPAQPQATVPPPAQREVSIPSVPQSTSPPPVAQSSSVRPNQVLTVTVTDQDGRYIKDLRPEDFIVYEGDLPQSLTYFNTGQHEPISLGLVVDMSESMLNKVGRARQALRLLADTIQSRDEVFLAAFNDKPLLLQDFTDSRALILQATTQLQPRGRTALYDAILDGLKRIQQGHCQKKALVILTDGVDTASETSLAEVTATVRHTNVLVYTIGIGNPNFHPSRQIRPMMPIGPTGGMPGPMGRRGPMLLPPPAQVIVDETVDSRTLEALSEETGAKHFLLNTADVVGNGVALEGAANTIVTELRQQYSIGYRSPLKGDVYREVRIETRRGDAIVRTQKSVD